MRIKFCGAVREVTGSCHLIELGKLTVLLECGMIQGGAERHERNRQPFPFDPKRVSLCILSHAHLDHCGRLPLLFRQGFKGKVLTTPASAALVRLVLLDAAKLQEEDAEWKIKRLKKAKEDYSWVQPLYTTDDAQACLEHIEGLDYGRWFTLNKSVKLRFHDAGHILGSAIVEIQNGNQTLVFTGDLGTRGTAIVRDPELVEHADVLLCESTYGNRDHQNVADRELMLLQTVRETAKRDGKVIIPSFAIGRTQELLYCFNEFIESKQLPELPIYLDSPMAVQAMRILEEHPEVYDEETKKKLFAGDMPMRFSGLRLLSSVEESKRVNDEQCPSVIIAGSGMCTGGRIKHHLKHNIGNPNSTVLFIGFQAKGTLGRQLLDGAKHVRIFGQMHEVRAHVKYIDGFSAHADRSELLFWTANFQKPPRQTFLVHGELEAAQALALALMGRGWNATIPSLGETWRAG